MTPDNKLGHQRHEDLARDSIAVLQRYCNIEYLEDPIISFHGRISNGVQKWPSGSQEMEGRLYLCEWFSTKCMISSYRMKRCVLSFQVLLWITPLLQAIKCVLVIPVSNAGFQRSFFAAKVFLGKKEAIWTRTYLINDLMMCGFQFWWFALLLIFHLKLTHDSSVQRNSPSLSTVKPEKLAHHWMHRSPDKPIFEKVGSLQVINSLFSPLTTFNNKSTFLHKRC